MAKEYNVLGCDFVISRAGLKPSFQEAAMWIVVKYITPGFG